jgi:hypothetical protein
LSSAVGQLEVPGSNRLNGQLFHVQAYGNFEVGAGGACPAVTLSLFANTGTRTAPITTRLAVSTPYTAATELNATFYPFTMDVSLMGDTMSGVVQGTYLFQIDGGATQTGTTVLLSGVNFSTTEPAFGLVMAITFSVSEPGNSSNLFAFQIVN